MYAKTILQEQRRGGEFIISWGILFINPYGDRRGPRDFATCFPDFLALESAEPHPNPITAQRNGPVFCSQLMFHFCTRPSSGLGWDTAQKGGSDQTAMQGIKSSPPPPNPPGSYRRTCRNTSHGVLVTPDRSDGVSTRE
ncbi:hypothetical protein FKM82_003399 [Ascaphus truei]